MLARRPGEDCEATIHRGYQRNTVRLVLYELRRRKVSRTAKFQWVNDRGYVVNDRFRHDNLLDLCTVVTTTNLRAESQQLILIADECRAKTASGRNRTLHAERSAIWQLFSIVSFRIKSAISENGCGTNMRRSTIDFRHHGALRKTSGASAP